jgi:hypothetical protein
LKCGYHGWDGCSRNFAGWSVRRYPLNRKSGGGALVAVSEGRSGGGQNWTRIYARPNAFPQVIHSAKRFCGPTGLEEYLGGGLGMALRIEALSDGIAFVSDHYFFQVGNAASARAARPYPGRYPSHPPPGRRRQLPLRSRGGSPPRRHPDPPGDTVRRCRLSEKFMF